jgi:hypothetical protein
MTVYCDAASVNFINIDYFIVTCEAMNGFKTCVHSLHGYTVHQ